MDHDVMSWALYRPGLSVKTKLILLALACLSEEAETPGICQVETKQLVTLTGLSRSSIFRALAELEDARLIRRYRQGQNHDATIYQLALSYWTPPDQSAATDRGLTHEL